jgi:hypothetical protein
MVAQSLRRVANGKARRHGFDKRTTLMAVLCGFFLWIAHAVIFAARKRPIAESHQIEYRLLGLLALLIVAMIFAIAARATCRGKARVLPLYRFLVLFFIPTLAIFAWPAAAKWGEEMVREILRQVVS